MTACAKLWPVSDRVPDSLPDFDRPPVVEVALAVQLAEPLGFTADDVTELAGAWADELPDASLRPALPPLDSDRSLHEAVEDAASLRLWLSGDSDNRVVQLQPDRLSVNWRKGEPDERYPRFANLREFFVESWHRLTAVAAERAYCEPRPTICEVLYVNHIGAAHGWGGADDTSAILAPWSGSMSDDFLPAPHVAATYQHFHLPDPGRWLDIESGPRKTDDGERVLAIYLTCRGTAATPDLDAALSVVDLAHDWIVRGFASVTTSDAHEVWERTT